jgi:hypothetical protein
MAGLIMYAVRLSSGDLFLPTKKPAIFGPGLVRF